MTAIFGLAPGTFPDLEVISQLGQGAQTVVYRVRRHGDEYALKVLPTSAADAVQARRVTGPPDVQDVGQFGAQVVVPVDLGPKVLCGLSSDGNRWTVTSLTPLETDPS